MKEKFLKSVQSFIAQYSIIIDTVLFGGFAIGALLFYYTIAGADILLALFTLTTSLYHLIKYSFIPRTNEALNTNEQLYNTLSGFSMLLVILGIAGEITSWSNNDKMLRMGIVVGCILLLFFFLSTFTSSIDIRKKHIPILRLIVLCTIGIAFIAQSYLPEKKDSIDKLKPQFKEQILKEKQIPANND